MTGRGYEVPAAGGSPARVFETPSDLARAGYTAVSSEALEAAFGDGAVIAFVAAVGEVARQRQGILQ